MHASRPPHPLFVPRPPKPPGEEFTPESQRQAMSAVARALAQPGSVIVLTGEAGLGKTTVVNKAIAARAGQSGRALHAQGADGDALRAWRTLCHAASAPAATPLESGISAVDPARPGPAGILVVDDAHEIRPATLRQLAASLSAGSPAQRRPSLILVGRSELREILDRPGLSPLRDYVTDHPRLAPMSYKETERYIEHLFQRAGTSARALMAEATLRALIANAGGNLRQINAELTRILAEHRNREAAAAVAPLAHAPPRRSRRLAVGLAAAALAVLALSAGVVATLGPIFFAPASEPPEASRPPTVAADQPREPPAAATPPASQAPTMPSPPAVNAPAAPPASQAAATPAPPVVNTPATPQASQAAIPSSPSASNALPGPVVAELLARGDAMLGLQDVSAARRLYERAADAGSAQAALALAGTYDPAQRSGKQWDTEANKPLAAAWYRRAETLGAKEAAGRLKQLGAEQAAR